MTQVYEIENTNDRGYILWIDGKPSACPFQPPIVSPGNMGGINIMRLPCSTVCPLASVVDVETVGEETETHYQTACGSCRISYVVTDKSQPKQSSILKSI